VHYDNHVKPIPKTSPWAARLMAVDVARAEEPIIAERQRHDGTHVEPRPPGLRELVADESCARWLALASKSQRDALIFCFPTCLWAFVAWRFATGWAAVGLSVFAGLCLYRVIRKLEEARFARAASRMGNVFETLSPP